MKRNVQWPKISIVTPSYNQGEFIEETITSVLNQNYPNLEYIIIDGGSSDNTVDIIKKYEKWIDYWISEPDKGQSHAINKGLAKCTGEIFNWLNSDDYYCPNTLFEVADCFKNSRRNIVAGFAHRFYDKNGDTESYVRLEIWPELEYSLIFSSFRQPATFFKLQNIKELDGVKENFSYNMDTEMFLRYLLQYGQDEIYFSDKTFVNFRLHKVSKTVAKPEDFILEKNNIYYDFAKQLNIGNDVHGIFKRNENIPVYHYNFNNINVGKLSAYLYLMAAIKTRSKYVIHFTKLLLKGIKCYPLPRKFFYSEVIRHLINKFNYSSTIEKKV